MYVINSAVDDEISEHIAITPIMQDRQYQKRPTNAMPLHALLFSNKSS